MSPTVPTIASGAIRRFFQTVRENGLDPGPMAAEAGIDERLVEDPDQRVPLQRLHALWEAALRRDPRPDAALAGAQRYRPGDYGLVGFVCVNSETLGEALHLVVRYLGLWTDEPGVRLDGDGLLTLVYRTTFPDGPGLRCATEATLAEILHAARSAVGPELAPLEVCFTHPGPADSRPHQTFFRAPVRFQQPVTSMRFAAEQLALRLPRADPQLGALLREVANQALARRERTASPLDQVSQVIGEELQRGVPSVKTVARRLAVSERTLRRRLEEEGTTFRALLDLTRARMAESYVSDRRMPLSDVAFLLGFSEPSAFFRAFKRWTGSTPSSFRARRGR